LRVGQLAQRHSAAENKDTDCFKKIASA
jgi:hypothetical protein